MEGGGVDLGESLADLKDLSERDESELSREGREMGEPLRLLRRDSARFRKDSVLFRRMEARLSVGDLTIPPDLARPEVRMNPRIELDAMFRSTSFFSFPGGDFPGDVPLVDLVSMGSFDFVSLADLFSFMSFVALGAPLGVGMLLGGGVLDDSADGTVELDCSGPAAGRSPEGVEMT